MLPQANGMNLPHMTQGVSLQGQLGALINILKEHICQMEKDQLNYHQSDLTSFFLIALDFRAEHSGVSPMVVWRQSLVLNVVSPTTNLCIVFRMTWR